MPLRKDLPSLQNLASDSLLDHIVYRCDELSVNESLEELRRGISVIKKDVFSRLPACFLAQFSTRCVEQFSSEGRPLGHCEAVLEIIMDMDIDGLRCGSSALKCMDFQQAHRLRGLIELDLTLFLDRNNVPKDFSIEKFHLTDLVTLIFPRHCTNRDLEIIGRECPKLEVLKVGFSSGIRDEGIRALKSCRELRVIDLYGCPKVSGSAINHLLSVHKKLEVFSAEGGFLYSLDPSTQCLSMRHFSVDPSANIKHAELHCIVAKFPNLTYFAAEDSVVRDLTVLKSLNKLRGIGLGFTRPYIYGGYLDHYWFSLPGLLEIIGANITELYVSLRNQHDLNVIFESCPNIEDLGFHAKYTDLIIPPFPKLKKLVSNAVIHQRMYHPVRTPMPPNIEFNVMLNLEFLSLKDFSVNFSAIKSMIFDDIKFPKLKKLNINNL